MRVALVLAFLLALSSLGVSTSSAQTRPKGVPPSNVPTFSHGSEREKVNENLLMLLGGTLGGPWIQMAQDISIAVDDGDNLRVLALAGGGGKSNLRDVLLVRGIDLGITRLEVLNDAKASGEFGPNLDRRIAYIAALSVDMLQLLARPEINSLHDLNGKRINILPKGSVVPKLLKMLGVEIEEVNLALPDGIEQMRTGQLYGSACICSVPIPAYSAVSPNLGFKLLEVPYAAALEESYLPASLTNETYPNLIAKGSKVQTIGASLLLISYNWPSGTERYRKVEKFVEAFFSHFDKLRRPPRHPSWRDVNLGATIRGWQRFPAAQQWLARHEAKVVPKPPPPGADVGKIDQERLFKEFLEWTRQKSKR